MKDKINKSIWVILLSVLLFLISCATPPKRMPYTITSLGVKANLGRIGIVSACFQPEVRFQKPMTRGAAAWSFAINAPFFLSGVGAIIGALSEPPAEKLKESGDVLNSYLATLNFQETMRERFLSVAREQTKYPFVLTEGQGPKALDEVITYGSLSDKNIDTVLEISVRECGLYFAEFDHYGLPDMVRNWCKENCPDEPLRLFVAVDTRLIEIKDGRLLYTHDFIYESDPHKFTEWGANNAQPFREELDRAFSYLATGIVRVLSEIQTPFNP